MRNFFTIAIFSLLGGIIGSIIVQTPAVQAKLMNENFSTIQFYNKSEERIGFLGNYQEKGGFFLFDEDGKTNIQMGAYGSGAESGQTLIGLHDRENMLRYLLRLNGRNDSPTLIMKDKGGVDRIIIGLDGSTQVPYFKYIDGTGKMKNLLSPQ